MSQNSLFDRIKDEDLSTKISISLNVVLYLIVSIVSMFHAYKYFLESSDNTFPILPILTTMAFEIGQVACLFSLSTLTKLSKPLTWSLFIFLTFVQVISNIGYGFKNIVLSEDAYFNSLYQFFSFISLMKKYGKEVFTFIYGGSLPIVALLFIKSLMNYVSVTQSTEIKKDDFEIDKEKDKIDSKNKVIPLFGEDNIIKQPLQKPKRVKVTPPEKINNLFSDVDEKKEEPLQIETELMNENDVEPKNATETVRMKVINGMDNLTYQDIDKSKLPTF